MLFKRFVYATFLLATMFAPVAVASAANPSAVALDDEVNLLDGGFIRGQIVEFNPATHVTIKLADGELRKVPVKQLRSATRSGIALAIPGQTAPEASSAAPPTEAPKVVSTLRTGNALAPPTLMAPGSTASDTSDLGRLLSTIPGPRLRLFATANRLAILQRRIAEEATNDSVSYHVVCVLPCKATLPVADRELYRIGGYRSAATPWFSLPASDAHVQAELTHATWKLWPTSSFVGGMLFGVLGGGFMTLHAAADTPKWTQTTGIGLLGIGGALVVTSAVLWLIAPTSRVSITPGAPPGQ